MIFILIQEKEKLQDANVELQEEVSLLETKLESMNKYFCMLNNGSNVLDEILKARKKGRSMKDIGFDYKSTNQEGRNTRKSCVASERETEFKKQIEYQVSDKKSQHPVQHVHTQVRSLKNVTWRCHYCGRYGHIRPYCFKLYGCP